MNYEAFKSLFSKSKRKFLFLGLLFLLMGGGVIAGALLGESKISYWIFAGFFLLLGLPITFLSIRDLVRISNDNLPLLNAIKYNDKGYIVWIYQNEIHQSVEGMDVGKSSNIVLYNRDGKMMQVVLGRKASPEAVIDYLSDVFPDAYVGYKDETRMAVGGILNKNL